MKLRTIVIVGVGLIFLLGTLLAGTYFLSQGGCALGTFTCSQGQVCVPQRQICNGHPDCPDGEDESHLTCGDFHGSSYVFSLMEKAKFNSSIHKCEQANVPGGCFCRHHDWVYCKELGLTAVPGRIQGNVSRLILANNSIAEPAEDVFMNYSLELIHLEGNGIVSLPSKIFRGQWKLGKLLLVRNKLEKIDGMLFQGLRQLTMLFLQDNRISSLDENAFHDLVSLQYLDLSGNRLTLREQKFPLVHNIVDLILDRNSITKLMENSLDIPSLNYLGLSGNHLDYIHPNSFNRVGNLTELDLSHNQLQNLSAVVFTPLPHLMKLFLGYNPFHSISKELFQSLTGLASLDLEDIEIENISMDMFSGMPDLDFIYMKKYYYCTFTPRVPKCAPKTDGLSTFENLLGRPVLRVLLWAVAFLTCLGNLYVFWGRLATRDDNRSLSWIVRNLAVADFLMGLYLAIIGVKDVQFRGVYHEVSHEWMGSWLCSLAGALAMLSSEVSTFILVFMSVERFTLIAMPFSGRKTLTPRAAFYCLAVIWAAGMAFAVAPIVIYRNSTRFYGSNGMCFPLHLDDPYFAGWQVSAFIFLFVNLAGIVVLAVLYSGMFISVWRTRHATCTVSSGDFEFAVRFFFIVLTNTSCWLPIVILKILAFHRIYIAASAYAWIAVIVVPVNSAFNPLLYTLTTPKYRELIHSAASRGTHTFRKSKPLTSIDTSCSNTSNHRSRLSTLDTNSASVENSRTCRPSSLSHGDGFQAGSHYANDYDLGFITPESTGSITNQLSSTETDMTYDDVYM